MTLYSYKGFQENKVVRGVLEACSFQEAREKLRIKKIEVIWYYPQKVSFLNRLSFQDSLALCTHLEYLLKENLPLSRALFYVGEQGSYSLKQLILSVRKKVEGGFSFSEAMRSEKSFDSIFIELIKVGEANGNLAQSFAYIKEYIQWKNRFKKTLTQSLRYPLILFFLLILLMTALTMFLIPPLKSFLSIASHEQTIFTKLLLRFTDILQSYGPFLLLGTFSLSFIVTILIRFRRIRFLWDQTLIKLPFIGPFLIKLWLIKVSMTLSLLLKSEIFLVQTLEIAQSQTKNVYLKSVLEEASNQLMRGKSLSDSFSSTKVLPFLVAHFIKAGEQSNNLANTFLTLRNYYSETLRYQIDFLKDLLPTICLMIVGGFFIWIVLGVFYPLYDLSGM